MACSSRPPRTGIARPLCEPSAINLDLEVCTSLRHLLKARRIDDTGRTSGG